MRVTPSGILLHHRIGNLAQVGLLRRELERETPTFPLLLMKVLYSGTHAGNLVFALRAQPVDNSVTPRIRDQESRHRFFS